MLTVGKVVIKDFSCCKIDEGQQIGGKLDGIGEECITQVEASQRHSKYISAKSVLLSFAGEHVFCVDSKKLILMS